MRFCTTDFGLACLRAFYLVYLYYNNSEKMLSFLAKNRNDIIYLSLLLFSVGIGPRYRSLKTVQAKKLVGSLVGLILIIIVSGYSAIHPILSALMGIIAIKAATVR